MKDHEVIILRTNAKFADECQVCAFSAASTILCIPLPCQCSLPDNIDYNSVNFVNRIHRFDNSLTFWMSDPSE